MSNHLTPHRRHTNIVAVYVIPKRSEHILLLKRHNTGYEDGNYSLIAGHVEAGESFTQAAIREAQEEAGISISAQDICQTHVQHRKSSVDGSERVDVYFLVEHWQGTIENREPHKCAGLEWHPIINLPANTIDCVHQALQNLFAHQAYSEIGWTTQPG